MRLRVAKVSWTLSLGNTMLALAFAASASAQAKVPVAAVPVPFSPDWTEVFPPFHIAGNLYYVGGKGLANYLITTSEGNILINSDTDANVPMIKASIEKLRFKYGDTKILPISHAHWDHDAGSARVKKETGAKYMVMDADVAVVESGSNKDFNYGSSPETFYEPTKVDRVLHDRDEVRLGGTVLVAHGEYFGMLAKYTWLKQGSANPFVDPDGYKKNVAQKEQDFLAELAQQKAATAN